MIAQTLQRIPIDPDNPPAVEYGLLFLLLLALTLEQLLFVSLLQGLSDVSPQVFSPRVFATVGYTVLVLSVLGIGALTYFRTCHRDLNVRRPELVQMALALMILLLGGFYSLFGIVTSPQTTILIPFLTAVVGMGVLAAIYVRLRGVGLRLALPARGVRPLVVIAVLGPVLAVAGLWIAVQVMPDQSLRSLVGGPFFFRQPSLLDLLSDATASLFSAFGVALLFFGAIQETLREYTAPAGAIAVVTVTAGLYRWLVGLTLSGLGGLGLPWPGVAGVAVVVLVAFLVDTGWRALDLRTLGERRTDVAAGALGVALVTLSIIGWDVVFGAPALSFVGYTVGYGVTVAFAALTYEWTRSVWVPTLSLATYSVAIVLAGYLAVFGGATPELLLSRGGLAAWRK